MITSRCTLRDFRADRLPALQTVDPGLKCRKGGCPGVHVEGQNLLVVLVRSTPQSYSVRQMGSYMMFWNFPLLQCIGALSHPDPWMRGCTNGRHVLIGCPILILISHYHDDPWPNIGSGLPKTQYKRCPKKIGNSHFHVGYSVFRRIYC